MKLRIVVSAQVGAKMAVLRVVRGFGLGSAIMMTVTMARKSVMTPVLRPRYVGTKSRSVGQNDKRQAGERCVRLY